MQKCAKCQLAVDIASGRYLLSPVTVETGFLQTSRVCPINPLRLDLSQKGL